MAASRPAYDGGAVISYRVLLATYVAVGCAVLGGCANAPLEEAGRLQSYDGLENSDGLLTKSKIRVNKSEVLSYKTIKIIPTSFTLKAENTILTPSQRNLITNAVDRTLCAGLSERFVVVSSSEPADLTVHAEVTQVAPTDVAAAALSRGASVAKSFLLPGIPVPVPRVPIGLGSLSLEAEARDREHKQQAAMVWGRGANAFFGSTRVSEEGDAYGLAADFGDDFSKMLVTGETPFGKLSAPPSFERVGAYLGGATKYPACEAFGRAPGLAGVVGDNLGLPPSWTDRGGVPATQ